MPENVQRTQPHTPEICTSSSIGWIRAESRRRYCSSTLFTYCASSSGSWDTSTNCCQPRTPNSIRFRKLTDKAKDRKGGFSFKSLFKFAFFVHATKGDTPTYNMLPEAEQKRPTKQTVKVHEAISEFEMSNKHLKTQKCHACMEIHLNQVARTYDGSKPYKCGRCKKLPPDFYDKWLLQPVWHERNEGATCFDDVKLDAERNKIVRYDLPEELESLTLSEKLLIRKCAPYVPSIYLGGGNFALKGQCVAFMQDITEMAEELPRQPNEIVTFIRKMGNSNTSEIHFQSLRVRRDFIIRALK